MLFSKRDLIKITLPLIVQQVLSVMVGMINSMMVSSAGEEAVSGVSLVNTLDILLMLFFTALVTGGSVVVSQFLGKKDMNLVQASVKQLIYSSTLVALVVSLLSVTFRVPLLNLLFGDAEPAVLGHAMDYFFFIALSFPFLSLYNAGAALFRVMGNSSVSMVTTLLMNLFVVGGNFILISKMGMGAAGAAISTLIARILFSVIMIALLHNRKNLIYIEKLFHYKPDFRIIKKILQIGIPYGVENCLFQFGKLLTQSLISTLGTTAIAANAVAINLADFQYMPGNAIGLAIITVVGRCIGAGEKEQAKKYSRILVGAMYVTLWLVVLLTFLFSKPLIGLYHLSDLSTATARELLLTHATIATFIWPLGFGLPHVFRSASDVNFPLVVSVTCMWVLRVAGAYFLALESISFFGLTIPCLGLGIHGVWYAMFADWVVRAVLYAWRYFSNRWLKHIDAIT